MAWPAALVPATGHCEQPVGAQRRQPNYFFFCLFSSSHLIVLCVFSSSTPQCKSVFRSYSQDFVPHGQASAQPFLPPTSSSSPHFPPARQSPSSDSAAAAVAGPAPSTVDGPLSSSRESGSRGNTVCLPSETSLTDSPPTPSVRTQPPPPPPRCGAARLEKAVSPFVKEPPPRPRSQVRGWPVPAGSMASRGLWKAAGRSGGPYVCRTEIGPVPGSRQARGLSVRRWISGRLETVSRHTQEVENAAGFRLVGGP